MTVLLIVITLGEALTRIGHAGSVVVLVIYFLIWVVAICLCLLCRKSFELYSVMFCVVLCMYVTFQEYFI